MGVLFFGSSPIHSNPHPFAPLGSAPAPRAPRVIPPLSASLPLTPAPPGSLRSVSVAGTGGVAARRGAAASRHARSSCEPPSDQPQEACLPPHERRRCLCGGVSCSHRACATAAQHARPHAVRVHAHRVSRSALCRAACCLLAMHRASASTAARTAAEGAMSPPLESHGGHYILHPCYSTASARRERSSAIESVRCLRRIVASSSAMWPRRTRGYL
jgi:hypothetical protein